MNYKVVNKKFDTFLLHINESFSNDENITLFNERNVLKVITNAEIKYVVKSFKIPHLLNKIVYNFFRASKAKRSYENSVKLVELDVNTPKPIGYIEFNSMFLFKKSYYVSEFFDYDFEIREVFVDENYEDRQIILEKFIEFSYDIHNKGVYHIDYSPGNILVKKVDSNYEFYIIDVNRMKFLEFNDDLRMKSLSRLTAKKKDNDLMVECYSKISNIKLEILKEKFEIALDEEKKYLQNKKRLKSLKSKLF